MRGRDSVKQNKTKSADEQKNGSQENSVQFTHLPDEVLLWGINRYLSNKDTAHLALVNRQFYSLFQPEIGKKEAKDAAECAIYPTKENVETLKALLKGCPALLLHQVTTKNRHGIVIKGTVYQIALHESDNELINDVIKPAFEKLNNGLKTMEAQREAQFPEGWMEAEEKACASALAAIDNVFIAFKKASHPNDVTELPNSPYTITINNQQANTALEAFRKAIDALYEPIDKMVESGRDPSVRLLERVIDRYKENYDALGGDETPRNNALMRSVYGYAQRFAPINFLQAFAQGIYYIVEEKEKLTRSFEYRNWQGHFILPLDSDPDLRLGYEYFCSWWVRRRRGQEEVRQGSGGCIHESFCQSKTATALQSCVMQHPVQHDNWKRYCVMM